MTLQLVGLSHQVAPVELRERVALGPDAAAALARSLGDAICLSTCNRTEVYSTGVSEAEVVAALESLAEHSLGGVLYTRLEEEAALHLFRVAAGLDSLVPGEGEILGQVRAAFEAIEPGPFLDRVFRQALAVGKRVRTETAIGESPASVSSAAAALAAQVCDDLEAVVAETLAGRRTEAEQAEQLVAEEAVRFRSWRASLDVVPAIASLRARAEQIRSAELAKVDGRVSEDERRTLESVTSQIL